MQKIRIFSFIFILTAVKNFSQEKVTYTDFVIKGKRQPQYEGIYKNGQPYSGYFKAEKFIDNIPFVDFYENGERKFRYHIDYIPYETYIDKNIYDTKSEYENGKIKNGFDIKNQGQSIVFVEYQNFKRKKIYLDIFETYYFNRITFELNNERLIIKEFRNPEWFLQMEKTKDNHLRKSIYHQGKLFFQKEISEPQKGERFTPNSLIIYYKNNKTNQLEVKTIESATLSNTEMEKLQKFFENANILSRMYYIFGLKKEGAMETLLENIHQNMLDKTFSEHSDFELLFVDKNSEFEQISYLSIDENGKIEYGGKVTSNADGTYRLEIFGKEKKVYEKVSLDEIKELMKDGVVIE